MDIVAFRCVSLTEYKKRRGRVLEIGCTKVLNRASTALRAGVAIPGSTAHAPLSFQRQPLRGDTPVLALFTIFSDRSVKLRRELTVCARNVGYGTRIDNTESVSPFDSKVGIKNPPRSTAVSNRCGSNGVEYTVFDEQH